MNVTINLEIMPPRVPKFLHTTDGRKVRLVDVPVDALKAIGAQFTLDMLDAKMLTEDDEDDTDLDTGD